jgi:hypothetical protein
MNNPFQVVELRRYTIAPGAREEFARNFETWFPEVFQQLGASVLGHFFERGNDRFSWLRGYADMDARLAVNTAFYFGPVWKEHKAAMNRHMVDCGNVLLLRPLSPDTGLCALPSVDLLNEPAGAQGIVVAQIFKAKDGVDSLYAAAEPWFAGYRGRGVTEAGILGTLDEPNNFPQHPIRTDGQYLVWLGILRDQQALAMLKPALEHAGWSLLEDGRIDEQPELVVLDPAARSRMRWIGVADATVKVAA